MERTCTHCDHPDSSLLRVVLIGEIVRADDTTLTALANVFQALGLVNFYEDDDKSYPELAAGDVETHLRLVK